MGLSPSQFSKQKLINIQRLQLIKKSSIGKHFKDRFTDQQLLLIESNVSPAMDLQSSKLIIAKLLSDRHKIKSKNVPHILEYNDNSLNFCTALSGFSLWMSHPTRCLSEQIKQRQSMNEIFQQGQIWMIIYSTLNALANYQCSGFQVAVTDENIYVSQTGEIVLSDAYLYDKPNFYTKSLRKQELSENLQQLILIVQKLKWLNQFNGFKYSPQLQELINVMRSNVFSNYKRVCNLVIELKSTYDNNCRNIGQIIKTGQIEEVISQFVNTQNSLPMTPSNNTPQSFKSQIKQNRVKQFEQTNLNERCTLNKQKFYRTTPILKKVELSVQPSYNINLTAPNIGEKNWTQVSDISSIYEQSMTVGPLTSSKDNTNINAVNRLFGQQIAYVPQNHGALWEKNRRLIQTWILKQKNMILEVPESDIDISSQRDIRSPSHNASLANNSILSTSYHESIALF